MVLNFYIRFHTRPGEDLYISGSGKTLGGEDLLRAVRLNFLNQDFWHARVELLPADADLSTIRYKYIFRTEAGEEILEWGDDRIIDLTKDKKEITCIDTWNHAGAIENVFYTKPFQQVFFLQKKEIAVATPVIVYTHKFKAKAPLLEADEVLCMIGDHPALGNWETGNSIPMSKEGNWWTARVSLSGDGFPIAYKYGVYHTKEQRFSRYEDGDNRMLSVSNACDKLTIVHDGFARLPVKGWKGAGIAVPVFSLRSRHSFGTGEFTDIQLLVDWARQAGLKLIQLLPVNDTVATFTKVDSYPYAAISAFALHPLYINLDKVAQAGGSALPSLFSRKQKELNALPVVDYEAVMEYKMAALKELYRQQKEKLQKDQTYLAFVQQNTAWLTPYAAFCYLRDTYKTADYNIWKTHSVYNASEIQLLANPSQSHHDDLALYYFIQYYLHLQLKEAAEYAHQHHIIVKGDLPIGIYRYSCDAWTNPSLYNMGEQAGAPPDPFTVKGQNWGFPTYNWQKMQEDDYAWWKQRFEQMAVYFDAFRIDHILGFFRIWSIPMHAVEGILGRFVPAIPVHINEFTTHQINFNYERFCKPFITDDILLEIFGENTTYIKKTFVRLHNGHYELQPGFDTQHEVEIYFKDKTDAHHQKIKAGLFNLISNVIFIEEGGAERQLFHFRIDMEHTSSYHYLDAHTRQRLRELYINYFYYRQDSLWEKKAMQKLPGLKRSTNMLVCGEDLGMVPHCVPGVMEKLGILSLEIQRMPKQMQVAFTDLRNIPYLSVVTPSTHDMSTIRGWWVEDKHKTQYFYNHVLGHTGEAPDACSASLNKEVILQHLQAPAMWSVFQLQDILSMDEKLARDNPDEERINIPAIVHHYWRYRMHLNLETLISEEAFNEALKKQVKASGR